MPDYQSYGGEGSRTSSWAEYMQRRQGDRVGRTGEDFFRGLVGGPAGWVEVGTNNRGIKFDGTTLSDYMTEDVYNTLTPEEWAAFAQKSDAEQQQFIQARRRAIMMNQVNKAASDRDPNGPQAKARAEADRQAKYQKWRDDTNTRLDAFSKEMGMSVDELVARGDVGMNAARSNAANQAGMAARGAGLTGGGVSNMNTTRAITDASLGYQSQRQAMGLQATQALAGGLQNQYMNDEDRRRYEQGINMQLQQAQQAAQNQGYQQRMQQAGGPMGLVGGAVGAYFGGAQGAQAGYQLGSGLGQSNYQSQNPYKPYEYQYPSGSGSAGSGGLSGRNNGAQ